MQGLKHFALIGAVALVLSVAAGGGAQAQVISAGYDLLETDSGVTLDDVSLPANFFGPGSDPFVGRVYMKGVPFATFDPDGPGPAPTATDLLPTDTVIRRLANAGPAFPPAGVVIPIQLVQLALVSVRPITVTFNGGSSSSSWQINVDVRVNTLTGLVDPPQPIGSMTIRNETLGASGGGTFDSDLPVQPLLTFTRTDALGTVGPLVSPLVFDLGVTGESWSRIANPLIFPGDGQSALVVAGLTTNFFPGCVCAACPVPRRSAVCYSVDGGVFNPSRNGLPLTPFPNATEGLIVPDPRHLPPNDVYALGTSPGFPPGAPPGGHGYATEGEIFQSSGAALGAPPDVSNVDRMSAALGVGPAPGGPPYLGPFSPNPGAPNPAPPPVGGPLGTFGLMPNDNVDALSFGKDSGDVLLFSVDPATLGIPGTHVRIQAVTSPLGPAAGLPLPTNPGGGDPGNEAASDIFKSLPFAPFGSYIPLHLATGRYITPATVAANQLEIDEFLLGLQAPALNGSAIAPPEDDLDAVELSDAGNPIWGVDLVNNVTGVAPPDGIPDRFVFFSIDTASPSTGPPVDAGDVLVVFPGGFAFGVFADGVLDIGLLPGDDIDGLALSDVPPLGVMTPGLDGALYSLHPGSPSVVFGPDGIPATGDEVSAADVFVTGFTGVHALYASAAGLGLLVSDNVNALDILPRVPGATTGTGSRKKLSEEEEALAKHGVRVAQKRRCNLTTTGVFAVNIPPVGPFTVNLSGSMSGIRTATEFNPQTAETKIPIEMLSMTLTGSSPMGPVTVQAGRDLGLEPSVGAIEPQSTASDLPGHGFFDVFVKIQIGANPPLHNREPFRVQSPVNDFPPYGHTFQGNQQVELVDPNGIPLGTLDFALHTPRCTTNTECNDNNSRTADACQVASGVCVHTPLPDTDGDGTCDPQDSCPQLSNPGQGPLMFTDTIRFVSKVQFCWDSPATIKGVVGPLASVSTYAISSQYNQVNATCHPAPEPPSNTGLYYVIQHDCTAGSWQSFLGLEPGRDLSLP